MGDIIPTSSMTKAERTDLARLARAQGRLRKSGVEARQAELIAQLEEDLAAEFQPNDPRWDDVATAAQEAVKEADRIIAERCAELGVRPEFRPGLSLSWFSRGQNADSKRRAELRKVGQTRIAALGKAAKLKIDEDVLNRETTLIAGSLTTEEARQFLAAMPTLEALMPPLTVAEIEGGS